MTTHLPPPHRSETREFILLTTAAIVLLLAVGAGISVALAVSKKLHADVRAANAQERVAAALESRCSK